MKKQSKRNQSGRRPGRPVNPHPRWLSLGRLWLDFTFTGGSGAFARFERLHEPTDLDEWFAISSLGVEGIGSTAEDVRRARAFRSVLWEVSRALVEDRPISPQLIKALNETAAEPPLTRRLDPSAASASWVEPTVRAGLSTIARDAIELLADPSLRGRVRECAAENCWIVFFDDSRPNRRRWCAPERCGNRHRARTYRARHAGDR